MLILLVILVGAWGRLANIGADPFRTDELNHHYAAQSMSSGHGPLLPSGEVYARGVVMTRMVSLMQSWLGATETYERLPAAAFGILSLVLMAWVGWRIGGPWVAVWATALLAIYPAMVFQSRNVRFYTYQLCFGIIALYTLWRATCAATERDGQRRSLRGQWGLLSLAACALAIGIQVQPTTITVVMAAAAWMTFLAIVAVRTEGWSVWRHDASVQAVVFGLVTLALLAAFGLADPLLRWAWQQSQFVATWAEPGDSRFYLQALKFNVPWIAAFLPLLILAAILIARRSGLFLAFWFSVPFVAHSFFLPWKDDRYFLLPLPALFLMVGMAGTAVLGAFNRSLQAALSAMPLFQRAATPVAAGVTGLAVVWSFVMLPAFFGFRERAQHASASSGWYESREILANWRGADSLPIGSVDALMSLYVLGRVDFGVQPGLLDFALEAKPGQPSPRFLPSTPDHARDFYTAVPLVLEADAIREAYRAYGGVIVLANPHYRRMTDSSLRAVLAEEAVDLCGGRCDSLRPYLWNFSKPSAAIKGGRQ